MSLWENRLYTGSYITFCRPFLLFFLIEKSYSQNFIFDNFLISWTAFLLRAFCHGIIFSSVSQSQTLKTWAILNFSFPNNHPEIFFFRGTITFISLRLQISGSGYFIYILGNEIVSMLSQKLIKNYFGWIKPLVSVWLFGSLSLFFLILSHKMLHMKHIYYSILQSQVNLPFYIPTQNNLYSVLVCKTPEIVKLWELFMTHFSISIPIEMIWYYIHTFILVSTWFRQELLACKKQEPTQVNLN